MLSTVTYIVKKYYFYFSYFGVSPNETLSLEEFLRVVGQLKFRGTSVLFRFSSPPINRSHSLARVAVEPVSPSFGRKSLGPAEATKDEPEDMDTSKCVSSLTNVLMFQENLHIIMQIHSYFFCT